MPSWLSGLIHNIDETTTSTIGAPSTHHNLSTDKKVDAHVIQKPERLENEIAGEKPASIVSLLRGKDSIQNSTLELIRELVKIKQDLHQAAITLIQDQQNSDLLIKVTWKLKLTQHKYYIHCIQIAKIISYTGVVYG